MGRCRRVPGSGRATAERRRRGIAVLAGFGAEALSELKKRTEEEKKKALIYIFVSIGLILLATLIVNLGDRGILNLMKQHFSVAWAELGRQSLQQKLAVMSDNFSNFRTNLWIATLLFVVNGGVIFSVITKKLEFKAAIPLLLILLIADQWAVDKKYLSAAPHPRKYYSKDHVTRYISQDKGLYRVYPFENYRWARSDYFHYHDIYSVAGYGPNPPARYQKFIGAEGSVMFNAPNFFKFPQLNRHRNCYLVHVHIRVDYKALSFWLFDNPRNREYDHVPTNQLPFPR